MSSQYRSVKDSYQLPLRSEVTLRGWVRSRRDSKGVTFIELNDGSRFRSMQLVVDAGVVPEETLKQITTSDCEGAGQMFNVTSLNLRSVPRTADGNIDWQQDFFSRPAYLTVSGQLEGEIFALAFSKVYTFGPTFRAENSNTPRHLAEFWMIEPEVAFYDLEDNMQLAEEFLKFIIRYVLEHCREDVEFFNERIEKTVLSTLEHVAESEFGHIAYTDAIQELKRAGRSWEFPVEWGNDLQIEHERFLSEEVFKKPVIVTDYPKDIKPFYMRMNDDDRTVRAMDVLVPRVGEIIGGSH